MLNPEKYLYNQLGVFSSYREDQQQDCSLSYRLRIILISFAFRLTKGRLKAGKRLPTSFLLYQWLFPDFRQTKEGESQRNELNSNVQLQADYRTCNVLAHQSN